ncbi:MAG: uncharacterized protein K0R34_1029 [Herbinix sp.]|jgi:hypothetical protein|nr:uncharacterized protein [Herbinix sp.]
MRPKELQCIITFHTTTEAMLFEQKAKEAGLQGRIIPVPREITAGCGLSWKDAVDVRASLEQILKEKQLGFDHIYELII